MIAAADRPPANPEEGAIWWATRRQVDPQGFAKDERFDVWLADAANARSWENQQARDALIGSFAGGVEMRRMREEALAYARAARPRRRNWMIGGALAASFAAGLVSIAVFDRIDSVPASHIAMADAVQRHATARGERREIALSDGTRIALNTDTILEVRYAADRRDLRLLSGQALFHVAKDSARPFVVAAGDQRITATGTAFDVEVERDGAVKVLLMEGRVHVEPARPTGVSRIIPAFGREELSPGQELVVPRNGDPALGTADVERGTAWNRGLIILRDDPVDVAIAQFNRYSDRALVIADPAIGNLKVSGVFPTSRREDFVAALQAMYPIETEQGRSSVRLNWREDAKESRR